MQTNMMLAVGFGIVILSISLVAVSVLLIGLILLQKNRGAGLSGAFGGVGGHTAFGTKTGDFLTWVTVGLTAVFLLLSIVGNYVFEPAKSSARTGEASPAPVMPETPEPEGQPIQTAPPARPPITPSPQAPPASPAPPVQARPPTTQPS
jgi:preprotein translocase subunit SecG